MKRSSQSPIVDSAARVEDLPTLLGRSAPREGDSPSERASGRAPDRAAAAVAARPALDFRAVYEAEFSYVFHSLRRLGVAGRDLEDLAHDVFVAFYRGLDGYDRDRPLRPWLFGIAFRVASDHRRKARHRFEVEGDRRDFADESPPADEQVAARQDRELVLLGLAALELDRRAVFVMHDLDGCAMPEIARVLSVPLNTCYSRLRLARADFAAAVRRRRKEVER